ncbi:hypothetical protein Patl1_16976 [Pistacia atlantica]|uniref:Uncharacterized protein n=1 Tax=Pistacia atlantica TaxID=434234 RepID=A0ACC1B7Y0_9ROSI|nr:hypothetical protein Patl1_16976 [Pistacia atlantica]
MKIKNKGKVYPSPSPSSSSSSSSANGDYLSGLKLLPAAIIALATVLPLEDREVLAYLITRSIKTTATTSSSSIIQRKSSKKTAANGSNNNGNGSTVTHKPPVFDCDCFDCYTSYWFRWDSSPNRELIHQAIEAFEGPLDQRSVPEKQVEDSKQPTINVVVPDEAFSEDDVEPVNSPTKEFEENEVMEFSGESKPAEDETTTEVMQTTAAGGSCNHKGLARKVLPDVLGLFNSRLWSLWSPNA